MALSCKALWLSLFENCCASDPKTGPSSSSGSENNQMNRHILPSDCAAIFALRINATGGRKRQGGMSLDRNCKDFVTVMQPKVSFLA